MLDIFWWAHYVYLCLIYFCMCILWIVDSLLIIFWDGCGYVNSCRYSLAQGKCVNIWENCICTCGNKYIWQLFNFLCELSVGPKESLLFDTIYYQYLITTSDNILIVTLKFVMPWFSSNPNWIMMQNVGYLFVGILTQINSNKSGS